MTSDKTKEEPVQNENTQTNEPSKYEPWLPEYYPERIQGGFKQTWMQWIFGINMNHKVQKTRCETRVHECIKSSPLIKLMMAALKSSGCEIDIRRHISCEGCLKGVSGGYDANLNQVIVCYNNAGTKSTVRGVLAHEMIHMFDYCRNKVDFKNLDHLACTEIRAANLVHCSFLSAWMEGNASPFNVKKAHRDCVIDKAVQSIVAVRKVSKDEALEAVLRVFPKCYPDLEPIGRRIRRNSMDTEKAYAEGPIYGYDI